MAGLRLRSRPGQDDEPSPAFPRGCRRRLHPCPGGLRGGAQRPLEALPTRGVARAHARRLLDAASAAHHQAPPQRGLVEPLSVRELEVLRLLGTDLDGPAIARELFLSLNTVRTHTRNVYAKLGVNSRRAAVRRAAELDLLPRASRR